MLPTMLPNNVSNITPIKCIGNGEKKKIRKKHGIEEGFCREGFCRPLVTAGVGRRLVWFQCLSHGVTSSFILLLFDDRSFGVEVFVIHTQSPSPPMLFRCCWCSVGILLLTITTVCGGDNSMVSARSRNLFLWVSVFC